MSHQSQSDRLAPIVLNRLKILNQSKRLTRTFRRCGYLRRTLELPTGPWFTTKVTYGNGRRQKSLIKLFCRLSEVDSLTSFVSMLSMAQSETDSCLQECKATLVLNRYPVGARISNILLRSCWLMKPIRERTRSNTPINLG